MKPHSLSARVVAALLAFSLVPLRSGAGACEDAAAAAAIKSEPGTLKARTGYGESAISGFDEFSDVSSPAKKYRKKTITGTMYYAEWPAAFGLCTTPQYPNNYSKSGTNVTYAGNPHANNYSASLTPTAQVGNLVRYQAALSGSDAGGGGVDGGLRILLSWDPFGVATLTDGQTVDLNPASSPINVVVQCGYVSWQPLPGSGAQMGVAYLTGIRDEWDISQEQPGSVVDNSKRYQGPTTSFPLSSGGSVVAAPGVFSINQTSYPTGPTNPPTTVTPSQTTRTTVGSNQCYSTNNGTAKYSGTVTEKLSMEDKPEDALQRAKTAAKAAMGSYAVVNSTNQPVAYEKSMDSQFKVKVSLLDYQADFKVECPGEYDIYVTFGERAAGSSDPFTETGKTVDRQTVSKSGVVTLNGSLRVEQKDREYTVLRAELRSPCGNRPPSDPSITLGSVHVALNLGKGAGNTSAGAILLETETPTAATYTPAALAPASGSGTEVVRDTNNAPRQVKAPQTFADIVTLSTSSYEVRFYAPAEVGTQDPVTRIYALVGTPTPYATFKFENPDATLTGKLKITETRGSVVRVSQYDYDSSANAWALTTGNGARKESLAVSVSGTDTTKTTIIKDSGNTVVSKTNKVYRAYPWGDALISEVLDPDGAALTTTSSFYENSGTDGAAYGQLKERVHPNGGWERYTYDPTTGKLLKTIRPHLNAPVGSAENLCRVTENIYSTLTDADGDAVDEKLTTTIERTLGTETGRSYQVEWSKPVTIGAESFARRQDIRCTVVGAAWNAGTNLVTETLTYTADPFTGRTRRVVRPDGTALVSTYSMNGTGEQTAIVTTGAWNGTNVTEGTQTMTFTSAKGQVVGESVVDIASAKTLSSWNVTSANFDALGRPTRFDYADGTYETRTYACCGLASYRDRSGATTTYQYDDLGRQVQATRFGIATKTTYDADGRVKTVTRVGTDASEILQETNTYDPAGRLTQHKDALNRETNYAESYNAGTGQTTRTTTNPDLGTVITVSARDGSQLSTSGTAAAPRNYDYGLEGGEICITETFVGPAGATTEWVKTYTDFAGRNYKTAYADGQSARSYFNALGQLERQVDPDGVTTLFAYNARGEQEVTAVDVAGANVIDYTGTDRITKTVTAIATNGSYDVQRTTTSVWETDNSNTPVIVSVSEQSLDGLRSWQTVRGLTTSSVTVPDGSGGREVTTTGPDGVKTVQVYANDRLISTTIKTAGNVQLGAVSYGYDPQGRQQSVTDARNGATTFTYFADDQIQTVTTPDPDTTRAGNGYDAQVTTYHYDNAGRVDQVTHPDATVVYTTYWPTGAVKRTWGSRTYPVEYTYDPQGRVKTLTTWQDFAANAGAAVTTWNYDAQRGWLESKRYSDNTGPNYTYKPSGRLQTRVWARTPAITTTYTYNSAGDLQGMTYSDTTTPNVAMTYDRIGRVKTITDGSGTRVLAYDASGQLKDEDYTAGELAGLGVHRTFDSYARLDSTSAVSGASSFNQVGYVYDAASRLQTVTSGVNTATYAYETDSPLVGSVVFKQGAATRLTTVKSYDKLNRLALITNTPSAGTPASFGYDYNSANQRTRTTREDSARWDYTYDALGQVTSGKKTTAAAVAVPGHDFAWTYDDIGNRKTSTANSQVTTYTPTLLNTYSQRTVPGVLDVLGAATTTSTVTVSLNGGAPQATTRQGELFYKQLTVATPSLSTVKVTGVKNLAGPAGEDAVTQVTRSAFVPATPEAFTHDADGNLTGDSRWTYTWDGENRLISMQTSSGAITTGVARQKLEFAYDAQGRRFSKKVYSWNGSAWVIGSSSRFLYDGWNLMADLNPLAGNAVGAAYVWGLDLSSSLQGAGGVGGLLFATRISPSAGIFAPCYDGNGNVMACVDIASGAQSATYEYNAFGEMLISDGGAADAVPFRFSTKYADSESGLLYYGLRYYNPGTGRWLSRDPIEERGGLNIYGFVENDPTNDIDLLGAYGQDVHGFFTYFAALAAGASVHDARALGAYAWGPDASRKTNAIDVIYTDIGNTFDIQTGQHALTGEPPQPLRDKLLANIPAGAAEFGRWTHVFQDSYAHVKVKHAFLTALLRFFGSKKDYQRGDTLYQKGLGHALSGTIPDKVSTSPGLFVDMARVYFGTVTSRFGGKLSMAEYLKYVGKISTIPDSQRTEFIKYIVRPCSPGDVNKAFDDHLAGLERLNLDPDSKGYGLPGGSKLSDWSEVQDWVTNNIK